VCQGRSWHIMLRAQGLRWTGVFRAGIVRWERKGEQARDLLRDGVLSEKRRRSPSRPHLDFYFLAHGRSSAGYMGSPRNERLQIQVCQVGGQAASYDKPKQPIAWIGRAPVTISKLTPTLSMVSKSSIGCSSAVRFNPYRYVDF